MAALRAARFSDPVREAEAAAAAVYAAGELRLVGHILRRADAAARGEERAVQRRSAETILASLRAGGAWAAANERNEDDAARAAGGIIGLVARGDLPPPLDSVAFALAPGAYSDVIETGAGFHVMVRPSFGAARAEFTAQLATRRAEVQELELGADAAERRGAALAPIATVRIREVATDPWGALAATDAIGRFEGGALTGGALAAELAALSWDARRALADAPAQVREAFAGRALVRRVLHVEAADTPVEAEDSARTAAALRAQLDTILGRVAPPAGADARAAVDRYMGRIAARHVPLVMPPPAVWPALLRPDDAGFRLAAVTAALERARALLVAGGYTGGGR